MSTANATHAAAHAHAFPYPVTISVASPDGLRDRLTILLRPVMAIPHLLFVGPAWMVTRFGAAGILGTAAYLFAIVNWFSILVGHGDLKSAREFQLYYLRWRTRALAYQALLVDLYPPFGDGTYPAAIEVGEAPAVRDRATIAVRPLLAIPHFVVLFFLLTAGFIVTLAAWLVMLVTGRYPERVRPFVIGSLTWLLRVEAYMLLLVDEYPPFAFD